MRFTLACRRSLGRCILLSKLSTGRFPQTKNTCHSATDRSTPMTLHFHPSLACRHHEIALLLLNYWWTTQRHAVKRSSLPCVARCIGCSWKRVKLIRGGTQDTTARQALMCTATFTGGGCPTLATPLPSAGVPLSIATAHGQASAYPHGAHLPPHDNI